MVQKTKKYHLIALLPPGTCFPYSELYPEYVFHKTKSGGIKEIIKRNKRKGSLTLCKHGEITLK